MANSESPVNGQVISPSIPVLPGIPYPDPCPFCGSDDLAMPVWQDRDDMYSGAIQCKACQALGPIGDPAPTPEQAEPSAIGKWNGRVSTTARPDGWHATPDDIDITMTIDCGIGI